MQDTDIKFSTSVVAWPIFSVVLLWIVFWAEIRFKLNLTELGIYPRTFKGLRGIIFSPFLHGDIEHLYNNSIPLFLLVMALRFFYRNQALKVIGYGILLSGFLTWVIGRESYHIGASGLLYVLVSFIFFKGIQTKYYRLVAVSLTIILLYGGMIWYIFPDVEQGISWEGHLAGLITGYVFSLAIKTPEYQKPIVYDWEKPDYNSEDDMFMRHFDENGNFKNLPKPEEVEVLVAEYFYANQNVFYTVVPSISTEIHEENTDVQKE